MVNISCTVLVIMLGFCVMNQCYADSSDSSSSDSGNSDSSSNDSGNGDSSSSDSGNSGSSDDQCIRGFVRCILIGGTIGCAELCNNGTSQCKEVDVSNENVCNFVESCPLTSTIEVEAVGNAIIASCSGSGSTSCFGSCSTDNGNCESEDNCLRCFAGATTSCSSNTTVPICTTSTLCTSTAESVSCSASTSCSS